MSCGRQGCNWVTCTLCRTSQQSALTLQRASRRSIDWPSETLKPPNMQVKNPWVICYYFNRIAILMYLLYLCGKAELKIFFHDWIFTFKNISGFAKMFTYCTDNIYVILKNTFISLMNALFLYKLYNIYFFNFLFFIWCFLLLFTII